MTNNLIYILGNCPSTPGAEKPAWLRCCSPSLRAPGPTWDRWNCWTRLGLCTSAQRRRYSGFRSRDVTGKGLMRFISKNAYQSLYTPIKHLKNTLIILLPGFPCWGPFYIFFCSFVAIWLWLYSRSYWLILKVGGGTLWKWTYSYLTPFPSIVLPKKTLIWKTLKHSA